MGTRGLAYLALIGALCLSAQAAETQSSPQERCTGVATDQETRPFSADLYRRCMAAAEQGQRLIVRTDAVRFAGGARF